MSQIYSQLWVPQVKILPTRGTACDNVIRLFWEYPGNKAVTKTECKRVIQLWTSIVSDVEFSHEPGRTVCLSVNLNCFIFKIGGEIAFLVKVIGSIRFVSSIRWKSFEIFLFKDRYVYMCIVCVYAHDCCCPQRWEDDVQFSRPRLTNSCKPLVVGVMNLGKSSICS